MVGTIGTLDLNTESRSGRSRQRLVAEADLVIGGARQLAAVAGLLTSRTRRVVIGETGVSLSDALDQVATEPGRVCALASGDPGFFGIVRSLAERFGREALDVHPAPSSVAVAFARLGIPWDDAMVVSAHGRPLPEACSLAARHPKVAMLTAPDLPVPDLASALLDAGAPHEHAAVALCLGDESEEIRVTSLAALASGRGGSFGSPSVLVAWSGDGVSPVPARSWPPAPPRVEWGRSADSFDHRGGMITKPEVRAVILARLAIAPSGVLWDIGAGSGSVGIEAAFLFPALSVVACDSDPEACSLLAANATRLGVHVDVREGRAEDVLHGAPPPDSVFVGGGGIALLEEIMRRVRPGVRLVAAFAALDRAVAAHRLLGNLVEVTVSRGATLPDGGLRLKAENPVFVAWGACR